MELIIKNTGNIIHIDESDFDLLKDKNLYEMNNGYVYLIVDRKNWLPLGKFLLNSNSTSIDHKDGVLSNYRRNNLRPASYSQNNCNRSKINGNSNRQSKYKNVSWAMKPRRWHVSVSKLGIKHFGGTFTNELEAALKADELMRKHHGAFAKCNFYIT